MREKIVVVEDDKDLSNIICAFLTKEGYQIVSAYDGVEGLRLIEQEEPLLILLDIMLPELDGHELCRRVRSNSVIPIIVISAKGEDTDKIISLGIGADDFLTKPFSLLELGARVKSQLRRYTLFDQIGKEKITENAETIENTASSQKPSRTDRKEIDKVSQNFEEKRPQEDHALLGEGKLQTACKYFGELVIDPVYYKVKVKDKEIDLTAREFKLLNFFTDHPSQVFTKEQLMDQVWGYSEFIDNNTITVYVGRIRDKLKKYNVNYLKTVWGVGYRWEM